MGNIRIVNQKSIVTTHNIGHRMQRGTRIHPILGPM